MRVYVLGAGASYPRYPLGGELFNRIDDYVRGSAPMFDRFDYGKDWPEVLAWLESNKNPLLREAYRTRNIEQVFTALDLAQLLRSESLVSILRAGKGDQNAITAAETAFNSIDSETQSYQNVRRILLRATEAYFEQRHYDDQKDFTDPSWDTLKKFSDKLAEDDVVVTLNYDSTIERVLLNEGKWSPSDGYGSKLVFQKTRSDQTLVSFPPSKVKILHLHGAIGWYRKPHIRSDYPLTGNGGAIPRDALTPAPLETRISLDPIFLQTMGIFAVDASLPHRPPDDYQILLHPSYLKDYGGEDTGNDVFVGIWRAASEALRAAEQVAIIGYSLPPADSAAWTLLLTSCDDRKTTVVNPDRAVMSRYRIVLKLPVLRPAQDFATWLRS